MLPTRRDLHADAGMGFASLALGAMLHRDGIARSPSNHWSPPDGKPHFAPRAKSVIWIFLIGGVSPMESFDPKPALNKYAGMSIDETPHSDVLKSPYLDKNLRVVDTKKKIWKTIYPLQVGLKRYPKTDVLLADNWPHVGDCLGDIAMVRSMWTTDDNHGAQLQFHTGRHLLDGLYPSFGSWVHYGLGTLNENLPQFVVLGNTLSERFGGASGHRGDYLGPEHDGVTLSVDPKNPLPFGSPPPGVSEVERKASFELLGDLNRMAETDYPMDERLRARLKSYELAFRMQKSIPDILRFQDETQATREMYGLDDSRTREMGEWCLAARRMVERGVRFVQIYDGPSNDGGKWDTHDNSRKRIATNAMSVDRPIAGLLKDLKQRGMLNDTLVCFMTEFGRTPGGQGPKATGREHNPYGFTVWMAGGGVKGGIIHGATDELGYHAVENRHYVTDIHATVLHQLGLDPRRLAIPGRKRLEIDYGKPITEILS